MATGFDGIKAAILAGQQARDFGTHLFIFKDGATFGYLIHHEERYITSYIPFDAEVLLHSKAEYDEHGNRVFKTFEPRGNYTQYERDLINDFFGNDRAFSVLTGEDEP